MPKIIISRLAPKKYVVNLFGTIWTRDIKSVNKRLLNHELIHTAQQKELLWIPFYIIYLIEWLYRLIQHHHWDTAYRAISFEREAYANDSNPNYLKTRRPYAQWHLYTSKDTPHPPTHKHTSSSANKNHPTSPETSEY